MRIHQEIASVCPMKGPGSNQREVSYPCTLVNLVLDEITADGIEIGHIHRQLAVTLPWLLNATANCEQEHLLISSHACNARGCANTRQAGAAGSRKNSCGSSVDRPRKQALATGRFGDAGIPTPADLTKFLTQVNPLNHGNC